jgi:hypothetical protein
MSHRILRILYLVVPLGLIAAFLLRPTPIVGVDGESLAASTGSTVNEINSVPCKDEGEDKWLCTYPGDPEPQPEDPGPTTYEVTIDLLGCWTIGGVRGPIKPPETKGCVTIADHVSSID